MSAYRYSGNSHRTQRNHRGCSEPSQLSIHHNKFPERLLSICYSYFIAIFSSFMVVLGIYLALTRFNAHFLYLSLAGLLIETIGACIYCLSNIHKSKLARRKQETRNNFISSENVHISSSNNNNVHHPALSALTRRQQQTQSRDLPNILANDALNQSAIVTNNDHSLLQIPATTQSLVPNGSTSNDESILNPQRNLSLGSALADQSGTSSDLNTIAQLQSAIDDNESSTAMMSNHDVHADHTNENSSEINHDDDRPSFLTICRDDSSPKATQSGIQGEAIANAASVDIPDQGVVNNVGDHNLTDLIHLEQRDDAHESNADGNRPINFQGPQGLAVSRDGGPIPTRRGAGGREKNFRPNNVRRTLVMGLSGEEEMIEIDEDDLDNMSIMPPSYESITTTVTNSERQQ